MLQKLNERIQGLLAWIIISLIAFTFAIFGVDYYMQSHTSSNVRLTVNGEPITNNEFEINYRRARQARENVLSADAERKLKDDVIQEMILNRVSLDAAINSGFNVTPQSAAMAIHNIPQFQKNGKFSIENYQQALGNNLYTPQSFQKEVQLGMILNQQRFAFIGTEFVLPNELNRYIALSMQSRNYDYVRIPFLNFLKPSLVSDKEILEYYQDNQDLFKIGEQVSIEYVRLSMDDIKQKITVSEQQIKNFYTENKLQAPIDEIKEKIKDQIATDLAQVQYAKQLEILSDLSYQTPDTLTPVVENLQLKLESSKPFQSTGGDEKISQNNKIVTAAFSNDVFNLGNNSDPIQLDNDSVVVLRVLKKYPVRNLTLAEVKNSIREKLALTHAKSKAKQLGQDLLSADLKSRAQLLKDNNLQWHKVENSTRDNPKASQNINELAFNLSVGKETGVELPGGDFVFVALNKINEGDVSNMTNEQKNNLVLELEGNLGQIAYELYIKELVNNAKIKTQ